MRVDLSTKLLPNDIHGISLNVVDRHNVRRERAIKFDREAGSKIDPEVIVRDEHNALGRQDAYEGLSHKFRIGIGERLVRDLPDLAKHGPQGSASRFKLCSKAGDDCSWDLAAIDLPGRLNKFAGRIVDHSRSLHDVGKYAIHRSPPLAAINSATLSAFSSRLPRNISAPWPWAGTK